MSSSGEVQCLKKALRALTFMNECHYSTVAEVARATGIPRPTAHRIMETLVSEGYIEKLPNCARYQITSTVKRLAVGFQHEELLLEVAKPMIYAAGSALGWPLSILTVHESGMIARVNTDHDCPLALDRFHVGLLVPMRDATSAYCYLAYCSEAEREKLLVDFHKKGSPDEWGVGDDIHYLVADSHLGKWKRFNYSKRAEVIQLIKTVRHQRFCSIEYESCPEGNLGVPLFSDNIPVGGIVMRYIRSAIKNTGRIQNVYAPKLQKLSEEITKKYLDRLGNIAPGNKSSTSNRATHQFAE